MAEKIHPSRGGFCFEVDEPSSISKTPSFCDFSIKTRQPQAQSQAAAPPPPPAAPTESSVPPPDDKSVQMPSGTYVIQFPKEQIFSYPPPENSIKFESLSRRTRRSRCCSCLCYTLIIFFILVILAAVATVVFYLIFRPVAPNYAVSSVSIRGLNLTSSAPLSPAFDVSIEADNPNKKLGIYYVGGSQVEVSYNGVNLGDGVLPEFFQPAKNLTVFQTALKGSKVVLADGVRSSMRKGETQQSVPLQVDVKAPVKIKAGVVKTWSVTINVKCDVTVDSIDGNSKILSKNCDYKVKLW